MNGRVYDPLVARFMSPDPYIQSSSSSQSFNRYSYVWNNPTNLTDPTGFVAMGFTDSGSFSQDDFGRSEIAARNNESNASSNHSVDRTGVALAAASVIITGTRLNQAFEKWLLETTLRQLAWGRELSASGSRLASRLAPVARSAAIRVAPRVIAAQALDETGIGLVLGAAGAAYGAWEISSDVLAAMKKDEEKKDAEAVSGTNSEEGTSDEESAGEPRAGEKGGPGAGKDFGDKTKDAVRDRDKNKCVFCKKDTKSEPGPDRSEIDHAESKKNGGNNSEGNGQNTCRTCNRQKGGKSTVDYLNWLLGR